jgi:hypothetical protein
MTQYRVEPWWGQWCVADYPPSKVNKDGLPFPLSTHRYRWQAQLKAFFLRRTSEEA